jgi:tetratricopeptide (TPR) repeat protein
MPRTPGGWAILIAAVGAGAYANSLRAPFIFDDLPAIVHNPYIHDFSPIWEALSAPPPAQPVVQRPLVALSLAVNYALGGLHPVGYHVVNILVHIAAALTLFGLVRRTLRLPALRPRFPARASALAGASALLWLAHPLLTECVTYVTQRTESLMALWHLQVLYALARSADSPRPGRWQAWAVAACALGMASKQAMVVAPVVALLYDRAFLSSSLGEALRRRAGMYAALAGTWGLLAALVAIGPAVQAVGFGLPRLSLGQNLLTQSVVVAHYLRLALWPHPLLLSYDWPVARGLGDVWPQATLMVVALGATGWAAWRAKAVGFLPAMALLTLAPTSLWPMVTEIAAERRMYLPLAALVPLAVVAVDAMVRRLGHPRLTKALPVAVALLLAAEVAATIHRNHDYRSWTAIWTDTVEKSPRNPRARANLGNALLGEGRVDEAIEQFRAALGGAQPWVPRGPGTPLLYHNLGVALAQARRLDEAIAAYRQALGLDPSSVDTRNDLAMALAERGLLPEAAAELSAAVAQRPDRADLHVNLGSVLEPLGRADQAVIAYRQALELDPASVPAMNNLGVALARQGRHRPAVALLQRAVALDPQDPEVRGNLGIALAEQGRLEEAITHFRYAAALDANRPEWRIRQAVALTELARLSQAEAVLADVLRRDPSNAQAATYLKQLIHQRQEGGYR